MRTLPAGLLAAMNSQQISAYFKVGFGNSGIDTYSSDVFSFKIHPLSIEVSFHFFNPTISIINIERGSLVNGVQVGVASSIFYPNDISMSKNIWTVKADIFPKRSVFIPADVTYQAIIESVCALFGKSAAFFKPSATWLGYQFLPTGKNLSLNNPMSFFTLLKQKYLIFATDNGGDEILFFHYMDVPHVIDFSIVDELMEYGYPSEGRRLMSRDELASIHYSGVVANPIHNLGFLPSTAAHPSFNYAPKGNKTSRLFPHLAYRTGDRFSISSQDNAYSTTDLMSVEESYDPHQSPPWAVEIVDLNVFSNTEGGALPSTIERVAAYTPLVSTGFDGNLDPSVNNLQAFAQHVDDMDIGGGIPSGAANDFQVGDGAGAWIKKTLAEIKTILGLGTAAYTASSDYAVAAKGVDNGNSHNHVGGDGTVIYSVILLPMHGMLGTIAAGATTSMSAFYFGLAAPVGFIVPRAGTLKNLYFKTYDTQSGTGRLEATVVTTNIGNTTLVANQPANNIAGTFKDDVHTVAVSAGDGVYVNVKNWASVTSSRIGPATFELEVATT